MSQGRTANKQVDGQEGARMTKSMYISDEEIIIYQMHNEVWSLEASLKVPNVYSEYGRVLVQDEPTESREFLCTKSDMVRVP